VIHLEIAPGKIKALVSGSEIYEVEVSVTPVAKARWKAICEDCAGAIDSLIELLQGKFSNGVMERICRPNAGLFPSPQEIQLSCSCPDWAGMCKHVAAVLYGIGARFDQQPELLFHLHKVDHADLIAKAGQGLALSKVAPAARKILGSDDLSGIFGLEMAQDTAQDTGADAMPVKARAAKKTAPAKTTKKTTAASAKKVKPRKRK
jgi:uncharacterized Zn finger protein